VPVAVAVHNAVFIQRIVLKNEICHCVCFTQEFSRILRRILSFGRAHDFESLWNFMLQHYHIENAAVARVAEFA